ncbi:MULTISPECIES: DNA glycosylase AlkZ-like family protein [unclassified Ornithinimicrobium]|uniref:DNA glycosylase AlkZ-like family protein n=1 Tax=unclassified Ornithinimicrobium TaxID=2615080 RepID=UPI0038520D59
MTLRWPQALAWRMRQQLLDPVGTEPVAGVVRRLGAVVAQNEVRADLAVGMRSQLVAPGSVARALAAGDLVKVYAFRGATHLMVPEDAGVYLALRAASRMWELPSWRSYYELEPSDWPALREVVREALADGPLTRQTLATSVTARPRFAHLGPAFAGAADTLLKPLMWQGDMSFGPPKDGHATFQRLDLNPRWAGIPELEDAGPRAVTAYFSTYGPATPEHVHYWLGEGLGAGRRRIASWISGLGDALAPVGVDGHPLHVLRADLPDLLTTPASPVVRLLPGHDPWVLGPGTADPHVVPVGRRAVVSRGANVLIASGVVSGTWTLKPDRVETTWFAEAGPPPDDALDAEVGRLSTMLGRDLRPDVRTA